MNVCPGLFPLHIFRGGRSTQYLGILPRPKKCPQKWVFLGVIYMEEQQCDTVQYFLLPYKTKQKTQYLYYIYI